MKTRTMAALSTLVLTLASSCPTTPSLKNGDLYEICRTTRSDGTSFGRDKKPCAEYKESSNTITILYNNGDTKTLKHCDEVTPGTKCFQRETELFKNDDTIWYFVNTK